MPPPPAQRRSPVCLNCGTATPDNFCPSCGQKNTHHRASARELAGEAVDELFQLDSRLARTVGPLLLSPGKLTLEYNAGRRARYSSPLRLYLVTSVLCFLAQSLFAPPLKIRATVDASELEEKAAGEQDPGVLRRKLVERAKVFKETPQGKGRFATAFVEQLPHVLFVLLPVFALVLKLAYARSGRFYSEHLVFALHYSSFGFLALLVAVLIPIKGTVLLGMAVALVYLFLALRRVYGESRTRTAFKLLLIIVLDSFALIGGTLLAGLLAFMFG